MKISVLGTGAIGGTIAKKLVKAGHKVSIANSRGIEGVQKLEKKLEQKPKIMRQLPKMLMF